MSAYDLHCHILPAIDDGPERAEEAFAMAQVAATDGTSVVVATPHARQVAAHGGRRALDQWVADFNRTSRGLGIEVLVGAEHLLTMDLIDDVRRGIAITLNNSRYLLVEINFLQYPPYISEALFQIQVRGMVPVLAHPERQATIQKQPDILADLVECGVVSQVTGGSLLGHFGPEAQRSAEYLVQHNLVHAIASDGHSPGSYRPPVLFEAARAVEDLVGMAGARLLTEQNPRRSYPMVRCGYRRPSPLGESSHGQDRGELPRTPAPRPSRDRGAVSTHPGTVRLYLLLAADETVVVTFRMP